MLISTSMGAGVRGERTRVRRVQQTRGSRKRRSVWLPTVTRHTRHKRRQGHVTFRRPAGAQGHRSSTGCPHAGLSFHETKGKEFWGKWGRREHWTKDTRVMTETGLRRWSGGGVMNKDGVVVRRWWERKRNKAVIHKRQMTQRCKVEEISCAVWGRWENVSTQEITGNKTKQTYCIEGKIMCLIWYPLISTCTPISGHLLKPFTVHCVRANSPQTGGLELIKLSDPG